MRPCAATAEIKVNGFVVLTLTCAKEWPHPERQHGLTFEWAVNPDDLVLAALDADLEDPDALDP